MVFGLSLACFFGAKPEMDAYVVASNFLIALNALFINSQINSFIPFISKYKDHPDRKNIVSSIIQTNIIVFSILGIGIFIFSKWIVFCLAPGLSAYQLSISSKILKILSIFILFSNFCGIGSALLDYDYKFVKRYFIALLQSFLAVGVLIALFTNNIGIFSAPLAHLFSFLFISMIHVFLFLKNGYRFKSSLNLINDYIKEYFYLLLPIAFSWFFVWMIRFTDVFMASFLKSGSISYLSYCQRIIMYTSVIANVICSIYFPVLSKLSSPNENKKYLATFNKGLQTIFTVSLGLCMFVFIFAYPIIETLFEHRNFLRTDTVMVVKLLKYYIFVLLCAPLGSYFSIVYFSYRKTKLAMVISIISSSINVVLNVILGYYMGIIGLAMASSIAFLAGNIMQLSNIKRVNPEYKFLSTLKRLQGPFVAGIISCIIVVLLKGNLFQFAFFNKTLSKVINLAVSGVIYYSVFIFSCYFFNVTIVREIVDKILKKDEVG